MSSINQREAYSSSQSPFSPHQTPYDDDGNFISNEQEDSPASSSISNISPLILLVIVVLAVIFFVYGLIHLVLWFLMKRPSSTSSLYHSNRFGSETTVRTRSRLQRQLQQLFRLHDSGLEQALIDALPVFHYQDLLGSKEPFDCAVCLCEFSDEDKLRLIPVCSHAFHVNCIDTWLLSNSTCPLCRASLSTSSSGFPIDNPMYNRLNDVTDEEGNGCSGSQRQVITEEEQIGGKRRVFSVRLGKFRNTSGLLLKSVGEGGGCTSLDGRRCYSMGSYQYEVGDSNLQVVLCQSSHDNKSGEESHGSENGDVDGKRIGNRTKGESFSVSKIWLWSKKTRYHSSIAAFS